MATAPAPGMFLERGLSPQSKPAKSESPYTDEQLQKLVKQCKKESFDKRSVWERTWMRNIHYVANRHWITYLRNQNQWVDVKLAKWIPKPVVNMIGDGVQALRAMFEQVELDVLVRPQGNDPKNVAVAAIADDYSPVLYEEHDMRTVLNEADYWFIVTGNVWLHTYLERDAKHGIVEDPLVECATCGKQYGDSEVLEAGDKCPHCGSPELMPVTDPLSGQPATKTITKGKGKTIALSPFEIAFPNTHARWEDVPYCIRMRWRRKSYYESNPTLAPQVAKFGWSKAPSETSMQLFRSLPQTNDLGLAPFIAGADNRHGGDADEEGTVEYELWYRPCGEYPQGLVVRWIGESSLIILHQEEDEGVPGSIPYTDAEGNAVFTFAHAAWEQRGGRVYGTSPLDAAISMQNILNQLWSFMLMIVNRVANPLWMIPKGSEIEKFTGAPGLVVKWNPLTVGGNAKPERVDGANIPSSIFQLEERVRAELEKRMGTFEIIKGEKPPGVDSFAGMQLLDEKAKGRFASAFKARGSMFKDWFKSALEIEREFGEETRIAQVMTPARGWTRKVFENAQLQGSFTVLVEDGSLAPKTTLGRRAAIEHLHTLGMLDPNDQDIKYKILQEFGQTRLVPSLDIHVQRALAKQEAFENWATDEVAQQQSMVAGQQAMMQYQTDLANTPEPVAPAPQVDPKTGQPLPADPAQEQQAMDAALPKPPSVAQFTPLAWKPWYNAQVHLGEFIKWVNGDSIQELLTENPGLEPILIAHMQEMEQAVAMKAMQDALNAGGAPTGTPPQGGGMAMKNSNQEAGGVQTANSQ